MYFRVERAVRALARRSVTPANAVYHATGIRVRDLPITPDKLLRPS
jgi:hypothetical protein